MSTDTTAPAGSAGFSLEFLAESLTLSELVDALRQQWPKVAEFVGEPTDLSSVDPARMSDALRRTLKGIDDWAEMTRPSTKAHDMAHLVVSACLFAARHGVDLPAAIVVHFDQVSRTVGADVFLGVVPNIEPVP